METSRQALQEGSGRPWGPSEVRQAEGARGGWKMNLTSRLHRQRLAPHPHSGRTKVESEVCT